ncbi:MAG: helix-turn-helix domain-containing protein [Sulfurovum sp.]|nr:helix-turn-helix domain-containing protein [Sulfurovum sp.]
MAAPVWKSLDLQTCYLQDKFRQDDERLIGILDDIRVGNISARSQELLESRHEKELSIATPTKLYTHNVDVDRINKEELDKLAGEPKLFVCEHKGSEKNIEKIFKSSLVLETLALKKGAVVIFIKNNPEEGYVNGTTGTVQSFSPIDKMPIVITTDGRKIKLDLEDWSLENDSGKVTATVTQVPLRLAWAITIHKSQGMTLDAAEIDLSKTFETGQGYVALSRIKNIEGLRLMGLNTMALRVDPLILHVDARIKIASVKSSTSIEEVSKERLNEIFERHISSLGGIVTKEKIDEEIRNIKEGKPSHSSYVTPTHIKTKNLIEKSDTLIKLATNRGMSKSTIVQHLFKIKEENPELNIDKYKPKGELFKLVDDAVLKLKTKNIKENFSDDGKLRLKPVFESLNGDMSYDDIRACMLFLV